MDQVYSNFGPHKVISKRECNIEGFMCAEISPNNMRNVKKDMDKGTPTPLPSRFCLLNTPWPLLDVQTMSFIDVPSSLLN